MDPARTRHKPRGFALIVTLSLMILLTVIAVGLLSLSSISLRNSRQSSDAQNAQANARLAMMIAIAQLQKYAGPDQRTSGKADLAAGPLGVPVADGTLPINQKAMDLSDQGLVQVQPGTRHWTGIWKNNSLNPGLEIFTKTPSPLLLQWLVSGNEVTANTVKPDATLYGVDASGKAKLDSSNKPYAVVLVGPATVGAASSSTLSRYVSAPLVNIIKPGSTTIAGRYAWWVGDEGVKARINIKQTLNDPSQYASLNTQRRGWETVAGFESYPTPVAGQDASLAKVTDLVQTGLLLPASTVVSAGGSPLQTVFHSATADSRAVLADSLNGGTKIDLSAILSGTLPSTNPVAQVINYPIKGANIIPTTVSSTMKAPRWDAIKDFQDRYNQLKSGSMIVKAPASDFDSAIAPLITDFRILMGAKMKARDPAGDNFNIDACGKVAIAIANPYSVPLKWETDIELEIRSQTPASNKPSRIWNLGSNCAFIPASATEAAVFNSVVFRIPSSSLAPGEARAYTLASPVFRPRATGTQRLTVDLAPFQTSAPFDFNNCIELENPNVSTCTLVNGILKTPSMDCREEYQTSLIKLEMRLAGSSSVLRQLERFELDNGYYQRNARQFTKDEVPQVTQPFPLILYSFQISQPGVEYKFQMPALYEMGQRASTLRTFADFNLQATRVRKPIASYNPPPFFMESSDSRALLPDRPPGGEAGVGFTRNLALSPLPWGRSPIGSEKTILFSIPSQLSSLAQLQHADLTGDDVTASIGHQPGNAMGNSYATPFVKRGLVSQQRTDYELKGAPNHIGTNNTVTNYYDISYLLNASLWDSYFFSTIPASGSAVPLSPALVLTDTSAAAAATLRDPVNAATSLMVEGAFNVNSTEKNAWKAFLASAKNLKHLAGQTSATDAAFPRSLEQISASATPPTGSDADSFSGYRRLTDAQLDTLAEEIVKQVRLRGPFVSLSQFVNRALANITAAPALSRSGALQAAIDESGANINFTGNKNAFSKITPSADAVTLAWKNGAPRADLDGEDLDERPTDVDSQHPDWANSSTDNNFGAVASIVADQEMLSDSIYKPEQGYRSTGIPGWLTQADVLQVIGNSLTVRSDTFRIRTYGESVDANGKTVAKAYCEAIVQRVPAYTNPADKPSARGASLTSTNQTYGRKFEIVSFRWLSPSEI